MFEAAFDLTAIAVAMAFVMYRLFSRRLVFHLIGGVLTVATLGLAIWVVVRSVIDLTGGTATSELVLLARLGAIAAVVWFTLFMFWPGLLFNGERSAAELRHRHHE